MIFIVFWLIEFAELSHNAIAAFCVCKAINVFQMVGIEACRIPANVIDVIKPVDFDAVMLGEGVSMKINPALSDLDLSVDTAVRLAIIGACPQTAIAADRPRAPEDATGGRRRNANDLRVP